MEYTDISITRTKSNCEIYKGVQFFSVFSLMRIAQLWVFFLGGGGIFVIPLMPIRIESEV